MSKETCPRCGEYRVLSGDRGRFVGQLCSDCALARYYEELDEERGR